MGRAYPSGSIPLACFWGFTFSQAQRTMCGAEAWSQASCMQHMPIKLSFQSQTGFSFAFYFGTRPRDIQGLFIVLCQELLLTVIGEQMECQRYKWGLPQMPYQLYYHSSHLSIFFIIVLLWLFCFVWGSHIWQCSTLNSGFGVSSGRAQRALWDNRNQTHISHMLNKCLPLGTIFPCIPVCVKLPWITLLLWKKSTLAPNLLY